jgi:hypothetical protein
MRVFPLTSVPPKPLARHGKRSSIHPRAARRVARTLAAFPLALLLLLGGAGAALAAAPPAAVVATGLTEPAGVIVDPDGHAWVADGAGGLCKVTDATADTPGTVSTTCDADVSGQPAVMTDAATGATYAFSPEAKRASTAVDRLVWNSGTHAFDPDTTIDVGIPNVEGVSAGPDGGVYVIFTRLSDVKRIADPTGASPTVDEVGHTAGVRGASAIAVGRDKNLATTVYLAENVGGGISALHPGTAATAASPTNLGVPGEAFGGLAYDATANVLYGGSANIALPFQDPPPDTIESFDIVGGTQNNAVAGGLGGAGGLALGATPGQILAVDDPSTNGDPGQGRLLATGVPAAQILDGPAAGAVINDSTPTFAFSTSATAECRLTPVDGAFRPCSTATTDTPAAPLADGAYTFAVRATGGVPVTRAFRVDTVAPSTAIDFPAEGAVTSSSPTFSFHASEPANLSCRLDTAAFAPCSSPRTLSGLAAGGHTFDVRAVDAAGNAGPVASRHFTVPAGAAGQDPAGTPATPAGQIAGAGAIPGAGVLGVTVDRVAPRLRLALPAGTARLRGNAVALPFRCSETCAARVSGTIAVKGSAKLYRLAGAARVLTGGRTASLVVHVPRGALGGIRRALRAHRVVTLRLALRAEDLAGNARTSTASVRLSASV